MTDETTTPPAPDSASAAEQLPLRVPDAVSTDAGSTPAAGPPTTTPLGAPAPAHAPAATHGEAIGIDDFARVHLRVGLVLAAERVPKSKKLLKLTVKDGPESERTILGGIAESYEPEQLVGRTLVFVANLQPRPLMGLVSHGMVLAADVDGKAQLVGFETPPAPGTPVR